MANTAQSKKRARQAEARQDINKARRSRIRTFLRKVEEALATGNQAAAAEALKKSQVSANEAEASEEMAQAAAARALATRPGVAGGHIVVSRHCQLFCATGL